MDFGSAIPPQQFTHQCSRILYSLPHTAISRLLPPHLFLHFSASVFSLLRTFCCVRLHNRNLQVTLSNCLQSRMPLRHTKLRPFSIQRRHKHRSHKQRGKETCKPSPQNAANCNVLSTGSMRLPPCTQQPWRTLHTSYGGTSEPRR